MKPPWAVNIPGDTDTPALDNLVLGDFGQQLKLQWGPTQIMTVEQIVNHKRLANFSRAIGYVLSINTMAILYHSFLTFDRLNGAD